MKKRPMMNDAYQAKTSMPKNPPPKGWGNVMPPPTQKIIIEIRHLDHE